MGWRAGLRLWCFLILFFPPLSTVCPSTTDLKVKTVVKTTDMSFDPPRISQREETVYVQGMRERRELLVRAIGGEQQPHSAEILDCASHQAYRADLNSREYIELTPPLLPSQEEIEKMAILQEKKTKRTFDARTIETQERKEFFGRPAKHFVTTIVGKTAWQLSEATIDGWYLDLPLPGCSPTYLRQGRAIEATVSFFTDENDDVAYTGFVPPGMAVQEIITIRNRFQWDGFRGEFVSVMQKNVGEIADTPLDPALFIAPAGFTKVDELSPTLNVPRPVLLRR
jgi:hypothetical protein